MKTDGSAPVWLGEGDGQALSPDGRFALALGQSRLLVTPDGESYAYGAVRSMSDLYLSSPLR